MKLDMERIQARIQFIESNLAFLQGLARYSEADFLADARNYYSGVHALQISIEAMLDILTHIVARLHLGAPADDHETLNIALSSGLVSEEHLQKYSQMNKFRNKVVHGYMDVDAHLVYTMLHENLGDFKLFVDDIRKVVEIELAKDSNTDNQK
jgi:uncharacterized protein YutE (UPF0331/DUF86 family)